MPQLDLAMFSFHIVSFSFFFFLMYLYIRGSFIPNISSLIKYRKRLSGYFFIQKNFFDNKLVYLNSLVETKVSSVLSLYLKFVLKYFLLTNFILSYWVIFFNKAFLLDKNNSLLDFYSINWYIINTHGEK